MPASHRTERPFAVRLSRAALVLVIAGTVLALGGIHTEVLLVATGLLAFAAASAWAGSGGMRARPAATLLLVIGVALTGYTLLQAAPMPIGLLAKIAPHNADVWARALSPMHEAGPSWAPIALDAVAVRIEVVRGVAYLLAFVTALRLVGTRNGTAVVSGAIVATGVIVAIAAIAHPALGLERVWGVYSPGGGFDKRHVAPLMNPNHLAAYLNIAFCLALASTLSADPVLPRAATAIAAVFLVGTQVWVASRGGVLTMIGAALLVAWLSRVKKAEKAKGTATWIVAGFMILVGASLLVLGASRDAAVELTDTDASKLKLALLVARMLPSYWLVGTGRGAFESTYPEFRVGVYHQAYTHPENIAMQWAVEWGVPVALIAFCAIAYALRPGTALVRSRSAMGAWVAIAATAVHNFVDFSSELPAVMIAVSACAAIVVGGTAGHSSKLTLEMWSVNGTRVAIGVVVAGAVAVAFGIPTLGRDLHSDQELLRGLATIPGSPVAAIHERTRAAMLRHPSEPYLPYAVALRASRERDETVVPWIGRVLERAPVYGPAHLVLARSLAGVSPAQARLEYRLALEQEPRIFDLVLSESPRLIGDIDDAMELIPNGPEAPRAMEVLGATIGKRLPATQVRLDAVLLARVPNSRGPIERAALDVVADLEANESAPWCSVPALRIECVKRARALAKRLQEISPNQCVGFSLDARALVAGASAREGLAQLAKAAEEVSDRTACLMQLAELALSAHDDEMITTALERVNHAGCSTDQECVTNLLFVAYVEERRGSIHRALAAAKRASQRAPDDDNAAQLAASLASRAALHVEAMQIYERLARRNPGDARWRAAVEAERAEIARTVPR